MDKDEREDKYRAQTEALYAAVGRFVVIFEHVCFRMETCIVFALDGGTVQKQNLARAVLTGLTAAPLLRSFRAVVAELRKGDPEEMQILDNVSNRVDTLIRERNDVIHRTWFIGWAHFGDEDFSKVSSWRFKLTNRGPEFKAQEGTVEYFDRLSKGAAELAGIITRMEVCLTSGAPFSKNFKVAKDGTVRLPEKA